MQRRPRLSFIAICLLAGGCAMEVGPEPISSCAPCDDDLSAEAERCLEVFETCVDDSYDEGACAAANGICTESAYDEAAACHFECGSHTTGDYYLCEGDCFYDLGRCAEEVYDDRSDCYSGCDDFECVEDCGVASLDGVAECFTQFDRCDRECEARAS